MEPMHVLLAKYDGFIKAKARRIARDSFEADELVQKANIVIWQQHDRLCELRDVALKAFISKTIRNALIDIRRQERHVVSYEALQPTLVGGKFEDAALDKMLVMQVIHNLPAQEQDIIFKTYFLGMDSSEIGKALNLPPSTVRSKRARAQRKLKNLIQKGANHEKAD